MLLIASPTSKEIVGGRSYLFAVHTDSEKEVEKLSELLAQRELVRHLMRLVLSCAAYPKFLCFLPLFPPETQSHALFDSACGNSEKYPEHARGISEHLMP